MMSQSMDQFKAAAAAQNQVAGQGYATAPGQPPILRQRIAEFAEVFTHIGQQVHAIHSRVVPPAPTPTGNAANSAPQSYDQMLDMLISAAAEIRGRLDEIGERV